MLTKTCASLVALALSTSLLAGCAANNREMVRAQNSMMSGDPNAALKELEKRDDLCAKLDRAVYKGTLGNAAGSNAEFDRAILQIREYESRATVSAGEQGRNVASVLVNDTVREYQGEGFEKVMVHTFKARNYLLLGDVEAARVEMRNANMRQDEERKRHQDAIDAAKSESQEAHFDLNSVSSDIDARFADSQAILQRLNNVYQNPFSTYLSGVVYELSGERDDAFIDYRKAYEMVPNPLIGADLARLGAKLKRKAEIKKVGLTLGDAKAPVGNTLVLIDNGFAPQKVEIKFPIPTGHAVAFAALPITRPVPTNLGEVEVLGPRGEVLGRSQIMVDIEAMAVRNLRDAYPGIVLRQVLRAGVKGAAAEIATREAAKKGPLEGAVVGIVMGTFNAATESADLRGWYALPRSIHVARVTLPADANEVRLRMLSPGDTPMSEVTAPVVTTKSGLKIVSGRYINGQTFFTVPGAPAGTITASVNQ
jgi:hypothetical protein